MQSLLPKLDDLRATASLIRPDLLLLTETWLNRTVPDSLLNIPGYVLFRHDRPPPRRGGGVAIYVRNDISVRTFFAANCFEPVSSVWVILVDLKIIVLCLYVPPDFSRSNNSDVNRFIVENFDILLLQYSNYDVIICGDFNSMSCTFARDLNISNLVKSPTRGDSVLDLFFASHEVSVNYNVSVKSPIGNSDHRSILASPRAPRLIQPNRIKRRIYDLRKHNLTRLVSEMQKINWHDFYVACESSDFKCNVFQDIMRAYVDTYIPQHTVYLTDTDKPWITPLLKFFIQKRWNSYRQRNFLSFNYWKTKVKEEILKAKKNWSKSASNGPRNLWKTVNSIRGTKTCDPLQRLCSQLGGTEIATESINSSFCNVFVSSDSVDLPLTDDDWDVQFTVSDVVSRLHRISDSKASGSDGIPTVVYKAVSSLIGGPLCHIFSLCISERNFPNRWKHSHVSPIPKPGAFDINNLRPISLLPLPGKLLESLVLGNGVKEVLLESFGPNQFGARPGSSTTAALIKMHDYVTSLLDSDEVAGVQLLAYDYTKAFDKLRHDVICKALLANNFPIGFVNFIKSYLNNRTQATKIGDCISSTTKVPSGVPQGSILGPYLYCIVAASLQPVHPSSCLVKYIDDVTYCIPIYREKKNQQVLDEHTNVLDWSVQHGLSIKKSKCKSLLFKKSQDCKSQSLDGVEEVRELRFLGVIVNNRLSWDSHVEKIIKTASQRIYCLRILKPLVSPGDMRVIYFLMIRSLFEYSSPVFVHLPATLVKKLNCFQNRVHKLICSIPKDTRASDCNCNAFPDLCQRRFDAACRIFVRAALDPNHILHDILPPRSSRSGRFIQPPALSSRRRNSFVPYVCALLEKTIIL